MNSRAARVISAALMTFFVIMMVTVILGSLADEGVILNAWYSMLEYIPFGSAFGPLCINLFANSFDLGNNMAQYLTGIKALSPVDFFEDVCILMLTAVLFETVNNGIQILMGIRDRQGLHNILMKMMSGMVSALVSTFLAMIVLNFLYQQLATLPSIAQGIISVVVSVITVGGAVGALYFVLGTGLAAAIGFVLVKVLAVNVLKVAATYMAILLVLLFLSEKAYLNLLSVFAGWGVVIVMLIGVDIMISSIFDR